MLKTIKKSIKYFIIFIGIIILLPTLFYLGLRMPVVQTYLVKRITNHFSDKINSTISIGRIEYKFFNKLTAKDILIKDQNNDTLLYSQNTTINIKNIDLKNKFFRLGRVILIKPVVAIITDSTGLMNLTWYLDLLRNPDDTTKKANTRILIDQIDLSNARFSLINRLGPVSKTKMDFSNLKLTSVNGIIEDLKIQSDTTSFTIYNLSFKESSGFAVKRISSSVILGKQNFLFKSTTINCDSSIINIARLGLKADSSSSFKRFTDQVRIDLLLDKSLISTSDLQYFIPPVNGINESLWVSGKITGTISELRGRNIELSYREHSSLSCDFDISGLPKFENAFIYIGVNSLITNAKDIEKINRSGKGNLIVPDEIFKLGNITFNGSFTGFITDFVTYGEFRTSLGSFRTDISLRPEESKKYRIKGLITGKDIDLGQLTGKTDLLGKLSMQSNIDGYAESLKKFAGNITGKVDSVEVNRYKYRNITLNGYFTEKTWDGSINIVDDNIKLNLLGLLNFNKKLPEFDFTLNIADANLYKLNIDKLDTTSSLTVLLTANFKGNSIDNLDGEIKLLNSSFRKFNNDLVLYDFSIRTFTENSKPVLSLRTDFVNADIRGYYNFSSLGNLFNSTLSKLMPSQFPANVKRNDLRKNNFTFEINFKNTDKINQFLKTGLVIADKSYIRGSVFADSTIRIEGKSKIFIIKNNTFNDFSFGTKINGSELSVDITSSTLSLLGQSDLVGFTVGLETQPDNFIFKVDWDNQDKNLNKGKFIARGYILKNTSGKKNAILRVDIDSTGIYTSNNLWKISKSSLEVDSSAVKINNLFVSSYDRSYMIDGAVSENRADTLHLEFKGIDISPLNILVNQKNPVQNTVSLDFKGRLYGKVMLTNVYHELLLESNIMVNNFSVLGSEFGNISITTALDNVKKVININASNNLGGASMFNIYGIYNPAAKKVELNAETTKCPITFLNPLLKVFASGINGYASGKVNLTGQPGKVVLTGAIMAENAVMKIDYLQTKYRLNDTVRFDKQGIKFNNIKLTDEEGNAATLSGSIYHKNFKEYSADLLINTKDCLVMNTKPKDNPLFYGTAYASGVTTIKSGPNSLSFDISAKTGKKTKFYIPLNKSLSVSENSFISFVESKATKDSIHVAENRKKNSSTQKQVNMDLNIDLEVTPDAEVQIIFDSKVGDKMTGTGSGNLNINLNRKGEFNIAGDYLIEDGEYLFTLGNILNKRFSVENGGKIMFNGSIYNAEIELRAIYKNLRTSMEPLFPEDTRFKERITVEPQLNLSGKLFNPMVRFDIYLPNADEESRAYLKSAIATDEELNRQFLYLLVMNSFISQGSQTSTGTSPMATSAMAVTTTEMISNQLSNWISQISNDFDLGFVYRPGSGNKDLNPQELQVAMSTQLLNDKVSINGNFDLRGTSTNNMGNTDQITGDFDAEIKLTEKIRFKVFNRFNDIYTGKGPYTQGIGILYKQDFNKFSDLFRRKVISDMKKEEAPVVDGK